MLDVANGMKYLHGQNPVIIHRDLKSLNVLIDENWVTKVTSLGWGAGADYSVVACETEHWGGCRMYLDLDLRKNRFVTVVH